MLVAKIITAGQSSKKKTKPQQRIIQKKVKVKKSEQLGDRTGDTCRTIRAFRADGINYHRWKKLGQCRQSDGGKTH